MTTIRSLAIDKTFDKRVINDLFVTYWFIVGYAEYLRRTELERIILNDPHALQLHNEGRQSLSLYFNKYAEHNE